MSDALIAVIGGAGAGVITWLALDWFFNRPSARQRHLRRMGVAAAAPAASVPLRQTRYSDVPALRQRIERFSPTPGIALFLEQAGVETNVSVALMLTGCAGLGAFVLAGAATPSAALRTAVAAAAALLPWGVFAAKRRGRFGRLTAQLPDAIRLMTSALRAGHGVDGGIQIVVNELQDPLRSEFRKLLNESHLYGDIKPALVRFAHRLPLVDLRLFATSAGLHRDVGGNFALLLDRLERTVRDRLQLNRELKTLTAESRMTGWIIGLLPVVVGVGIALMNPSYFAVLLSNETGRILLASGVGLEFLGFALLRWLTSPRLE
jgi:tight adherence protein B